MNEKRIKLREQIKANLIAAAASGKDLEGIFYLCLPYILLIISVFDRWFPEDDQIMHPTINLNEQIGQD